MLVKYSFVDGEKSEVEVSEELGEMILDMERKASNLDRKERYHCYSIDAAVYEGSDYASDEDTLSDIITREDNDKLYEAIARLPEVQRSRFLRYAAGVPKLEIARQDGVAYSSVTDSVELAKKNLKKYLKSDR